MMKTTYNDGGREDAGYKGKTGDCGTRAIAIATGLDYQEENFSPQNWCLCKHNEKDNGSLGMEMEGYYGNWNWMYCAS